MFDLVIDTGGTFTDAALLGGDRQISVAKFPTNPANPSVSIMGCIELLARQQNYAIEELLADTNTVVIGTTLPTNTIVEKKAPSAVCCIRKVSEIYWS